VIEISPSPSTENLTFDCLKQTNILKKAQILKKGGTNIEEFKKVFKLNTDLKAKSQFI